MTFTFIDFCAGIGGAHKALKSLGGECLGFSEIDVNAEQTYKELHGDYKNFGDLMKINPLTLPKFDILTAGFPCQSFSVVGKRKGLIDPRGQIIYGIANILKTTKPKSFILENVKGLLSIDKGAAFKSIIELLESCNYNLFYKVLNSAYYGVPHSRERIYIVGFRNDLNIIDFNFPKSITTSPLNNYLIDETSEHILKGSGLDTFKNKYLQNKYNKGIYKYDELTKLNYTVIDGRQSDLRLYKNSVPTIRTGRQGILYVKNGIIRRLSGYEALLLQGFDKISSTHAAQKIANSKLLAQAGNAMTVNVMFEISKFMLQVLHAESRRTIATGV